VSGIHEFEVRRDTSYGKLDLVRLLISGSTTAIACSDYSQCILNQGHDRAQQRSSAKPGRASLVGCTDKPQPDPPSSVSSSLPINLTTVLRSDLSSHFTGCWFQRGVEIMDSKLLVGWSAASLVRSTIGLGIQVLPPTVSHPRMPKGEEGQLRLVR
jgi:hypothetical protein